MLLRQNIYIVYQNISQITVVKIISWNVNGVRAAVKKDLISKIYEMNPDVLCLQETKAQDDQVLEALEALDGYEIFVNSAERKGYAGTAILTKSSPIRVKNDMGVEIHDQEGRLIAAEYSDFYVVTTYVPNSGQGLVRLDYRTTWDKELLTYLKKLENKKPVILCGDLNVCHKEIDIARPKANYNKSAGYTQKEIDGMDNFVNAGFKDTFRELHPQEIKYSWWSLRGGAREKNIGWRLDYFLISESLMSSVDNADIWTDVIGSDHCPVILELK